ncbi:membrane hypothetical protein [Candidatus Sulfotelmatomonas gaucii]|uniref:Uncharacterized protein n=1 Tax=Candidatus Sulfuritelmatomonas gaucii TaxID=2043161 RepID=A0A2N9M320_9BACT|nr:membrane hypothetical protein [Candidatus Sulfotelmatomonas gaucii]
MLAYDAQQGIASRSAIFVVLICLVSVVSLLVLWQARSILLLLFAGYIGALILTTLTTAFQSWFHIRRRGLAFTMVICATVAVLAVGIWLRGPALVQQIGDLRIDIAAATRGLGSRFQAQGWEGSLTIAWYCVAHFLEGNVITPLAERKIVRLPPALTLAVQLLMASVAGVLGVALAAPLTAFMLGVADVLLPSDTARSSRLSTQAPAAPEKLDARVQAS